jgi:hypothetical protein
MHRLRAAPPAGPGPSGRLAPPRQASSLTARGSQSALRLPGRTGLPPGSTTRSMRARHGGLLSLGSGSCAQARAQTITPCAQVRARLCASDRVHQAASDLGADSGSRAGVRQRGRFWRMSRRARAFCGCVAGILPRPAAGEPGFTLAESHQSWYIAFAHSFLTQGTMLDSAGKDCLICGQCCAGKPRIRDDRGHYYCKSCYQAVIARRGLFDTSLDAMPGGSSTFPIAPPPDSDVLGEILSETAADSGAGLPAIQDDEERPAWPPCPNCDEQVHPHASVCTNCGCSLRAATIVAAPGQHTAAAPPQAARTFAPPSGRASGIAQLSPFIVATASAAVAVTDGMVHGLGLLMYESGDEHDTLQRIIRVSFPALNVLFALWLGLVAIRMLQERAGSAASLRTWAVVKLGLLGTLLVLSLFLQLALGYSDVTPEIAPPSRGMLVIFGLHAAWTLAWPLFVIRWLNRPDVRAELARLATAGAYLRR